MPVGFQLPPALLNSEDRMPPPRLLVKVVEFYDAGPAAVTATNVYADFLPGSYGSQTLSMPSILPIKFAVGVILRPVAAE